MPKEENYTTSQAEEMKLLYEQHPCVDTVETIMEAFGKSKRSVIAKLSSMKVYKSPARTNKSGGRIIKKSELASMIGSRLEVSIPSIEKANKADLETLDAALIAWFGDE